VYGRWGAKSLIFAKYVPGLAAVATTLAGESRINLVRFIIYDGIGAALWAAGAVALGAIFDDAVDAVLLTLQQLGSYALLLLALALALFIAVKWRNRRMFLMQIQMDRLTPEELEALMREQMGLTILDVRSAETRARWMDSGQHSRRGYRRAAARCQLGSSRLLRLSERRQRGDRELVWDQPPSGKAFIKTSATRSKPASFASCFVVLSHDKCNGCHANIWENRKVKSVSQGGPLLDSASLIEDALCGQSRSGRQVCSNRAKSSWGSGLEAM
jgi:hypothetical protein